MKPSAIAALAAALLFCICGCDRKNSRGTDGGTNPHSLPEARAGFRTRLTRQTVEGLAVVQPPSNLFRTVKYTSTVGELPAYVSVPTKGARKQPAIIWLAGGFDNSIGDAFWQIAPPSNDQSARAFREAGIVMMFPTLRGGNTGPGFKEGFYGEVDDVLAAYEFLVQQDYVDAGRIYLGGHSTGGTLAMLVAACTNQFRAVFSFGPVAEPCGYGSENLPFDVNDRRECQLRSPIRWLHSIMTPTFVFEGASEPGNNRELTKMARKNTNPLVEFHPVKGFNHFSALLPTTRLVAKKILAAEIPNEPIVILDQELPGAQANQR
jgi:acetyl esterase/lipase